MSTFPMRRNRRHKLKADINVVPYIDVMLVLLVIFMVTAPLLTLGIDVRLPQVNASAIAQPKQQIVVQIHLGGGLSIVQTDSSGVASSMAVARNELVQRVTAYRDANRDLDVFVAGDGAVRYQSVLAVLQLLRSEANVPKATLLTQPVDSAGP